MFTSIILEKGDIMSNNTDETLFLVTSRGERHEDHIPEQICPLGFIKQFVSKKTYDSLLEATDWVLDVRWIDENDVAPESRQEFAATFERFRHDQETEEDCEDFVDLICLKHLFPIRLDENKCCQIPIT